MAPRQYHHGALREALIAAADAILAERGVEGFTLREAARRAGVSAAAPAHHFASVAGLLTEVAIGGYEELTRFLRDAHSTGSGPSAQLRVSGLGYVRFALAFPGRFKLMYRKDLLNDDPRLHAAAGQAYGQLETAMRAYLGLASDAPLDAEAQTLMLGCWSAVHGFAHLAIEGRFAQGGGAHRVRDFAEDRLPAMLAALLPDRAP
ncbi:TetR/AcrR family transcriptional regulator [Terrarubrum flagellatum]|uniref:TetR/AcrR family transcriptional regulator n=1 Tax=Terrirubrum flagellatum TaxID=2895980 RepID=UPI0031454A88